jgi:hypothetical protein
MGTLELVAGVVTENIQNCGHAIKGKQLTKIKYWTTKYNYKVY